MREGWKERGKEGGRDGWREGGNDKGRGEGYTYIDKSVRNREREKWENLFNSERKGLS